MGAEVLVGKEVIGLTRDVMNCMKEYAVCKQEEITERKRIKAQLTAITKMIDGSIADYIQQMAIHFDETEQKTVYVDIAYLIQEGQYNENQKNVRINKISKLLSCPKERTTKILYYMEKEKI